MIWAAVTIGTDGRRVATAGEVVGLFAGLLIFHGILNSLATRWLAQLSKGFVFVNLGTTFCTCFSVLLLIQLGTNTKAVNFYGLLVIIIVLLAKTPRSEMHSASYVFGSEGVINGGTGWNTGIAFLFGLLSVQWTVRLGSDVQCSSF
jgi:hypothetical protein